MSNVDTPPDPWFSNIIFNPEYFVAPTGGGGGISQSFADSHYLQSGANVNAISNATSTLFNNKVNIIGNVGIGTSGSNVNCKLTVEGRTITGTGATTFNSVFNTNIGLIVADNTSGDPQQLIICDTVNANSALLLGIRHNGGSVNTYSQIQSITAGDTYKKLSLNPSGGNVGVGTTNPKGILDIRGRTFTGISETTVIPYTNGNQLMVAGAGNANFYSPMQLTINDTNAINMALYIGTNYNGAFANSYSSIQSAYFGTGAKPLVLNGDGGNVGIGTTNPNDKLSIYSDNIGENIKLTLRCNTNREASLFFDRGGVSTWNLFQKGGGFGAGAGNLSLESGTGTVYDITQAGLFTLEKNLVVGNANTGSPNMQLGTSFNNIGVASTAGAFSSSSASGDMVIRSTGKMLLQSATGVAPFCINTNNFILLGKGLTVIPTFPVTVSTNESTNQFMASPYSAAIYSGFNTNYLTTNPGIGFGVLCSAAFSTACFFYSDRRIKKDFEPINNSLEILEKINLTKYKYIDFVVKGNMTHYGVIAQEVEEVIPEIMNTHKDFIPNIYKNANSYDGLNTIYIDTTDITIGDKIKIYNDTNQEYLIDVVDVDVDANYIVIKNPIENYKQDTLLFFYGKEIPDFKHVNYDALFVINMKATQELYKRLKAIETWAISMGMGAPI